MTNPESKQYSHGELHVNVKQESWMLVPQVAVFNGNNGEEFEIDASLGHGVTRKDAGMDNYVLVSALDWEREGRAYSFPSGAYFPDGHKAAEACNDACRAYTDGGWMPLYSSMYDSDRLEDLQNLIDRPRPAAVVITPESREKMRVAVKVLVRETCFELKVLWPFEMPEKYRATREDVAGRRHPKMVKPAHVFTTMAEVKTACLEILRQKFPEAEL